MSLEYIPIPSAREGTIDDTIDKWIVAIKKLAHTPNSDLDELPSQNVSEEIDKIPIPL